MRCRQPPHPTSMLDSSPRGQHGGRRVRAQFAALAHPLERARDRAHREAPARCLRHREL